MPKPERPTYVIGLAVRRRIEEIPRSRRIWAPRPISRHSLLRLVSESGLSMPAILTGTPAVPSRKKMNTPRPFSLNAAKVLRMLSPREITQEEFSEFLYSLKVLRSDFVRMCAGRSAVRDVGAVRVCKPGDPLHRSSYHRSWPPSRRV